MIRGEIAGLESNVELGFHIHSAGFDGLDCGATGGHFNPQGVNHGAWYNTPTERHVGDLK